MIDITWSERSALPKPEPEPNWRSLYEAEKAAHEETKQVLAGLQSEYDALENMYVELQEQYG